MADTSSRTKKKPSRNEGGSTLKWLFLIPGRKNLYVLVLMIVQALLGASGVFYALCLRNIVDTATAHDSAGFWRNVLLTVLLIVGQLTLLSVNRWLGELSRATFENLFKGRLMRNILRRDFASVNAIHSGEWLNRLTNDSVVVANGYVDITPGLCGMVVKLVSAVAMVIALESKFAVLLVPMGLVLLLLSFLFRSVLKKLHKGVQESDGKLRIFLQERIGSLIMIRSFAAEKQTEEEAEERMSRHKAARMRKLRFSNVCNFCLGAAMYGMYLLGAVYCGYGILKGTITFGTMTAVTQLISQIQAPFANISGFLPRYYAMTASAERLMEIEYFEDDGEEPLSLSEIEELYKDRFTGFGLKNARFTYYPNVENINDLSKANQPIVLDDISLEIRKGEFVAFTGHSGCGKSTVLKLLMSIYKLDSGERFLTGKDNMYELLDSKWHRLFAYVPQGNQLMTGTVRDVIAFADKSRSDRDDEITEALRVACADSFIDELENGIDTLLGERGTGLSEGQMQRIAVARALFSGSPILLLDESTSALDEPTEKRLLENLRSMTDKTVVIVTHRPAALGICDRVLRFTENGIAEV